MLILLPRSVSLAMKMPIAPPVYHLVTIAHHASPETIFFKGIVCQRVHQDIMLLITCAWNVTLDVENAHFCPIIAQTVKMDPC